MSETWLFSSATNQGTFTLRVAWPLYVVQIIIIKALAKAAQNLVSSGAFRQAGIIANVHIEEVLVKLPDGDAVERMINFQQNRSRPFVPEYNLSGVEINFRYSVTTHRYGSFISCNIVKITTQTDIAL